jgi:DNA-directed RNA polymerase subunit H (RpoH/RPB5)
METISVTHIYSARNNLLAILEETGYDVSEYAHCGIQQVGAMMDQKQLDLLLTHKNGKKIFVKFYLDGRLNIASEACSFYESNEDEPPILTKEDNLMIIVKMDPNDALIAALNTLWNDSQIYASVINIKRLQFNILKHVQVPKHEILTVEEQAEVFKQHNIQTIADLPAISRYDPVALVLCMRPGMVCRITRKSKTSVSTFYYRACV